MAVSLRQRPASTATADPTEPCLNYHLLSERQDISNKRPRSSRCELYLAAAAMLFAVIVVVHFFGNTGVWVLHNEQRNDDAATGLQPLKSSPFQIPSESWLKGHRLGNVDYGITKHDVQQLIAIGARGGIADLVGQTVCAEDSPVATATNWDPFHHASNGDDITREDTSQLIFRAIHENQYGPAREEAIARLNHWDEWQGIAEDNRYKQRTSNNTFSSIGNVDFECPDAKFLIHDGFTQSVGLGSSLRRWGNVPLLLTALAHRRILIFTVPNGTANIPLASCDRGDLQCSFLPMSPCVLTREEVEQAPMMDSTKSNNRHGGLGRFLENNSNERVLRFSNARAGSDSIIAGLASSLNEIYSAPSRNVTKSEKVAALGKIKRVMATEHGDMKVKDRLEAAAFLFITRPNRAMREIISKSAKDSFPASYDASSTVGLPIRASDKCKNEADCIEFEAYMDQLGAAFPLQSMDHIILTSEDKKVLASGHAYEGDVKASFITNRYEVAQGTGSYRASRWKGVSQEEVMASTMTAWAFQLRAGSSFLNLCSNFHVLIESSIKFGCGMATTIRDQNVTCNLGGGRKPIIRNTEWKR